MSVATVICLKWGTKYTSEQVNRLFRSVAKNSTVDVDYACLTDDPDGLDENIEVIDIDQFVETERFWGKVWLFDNKVFNDSKYVLLDIDTVILGNIDELLQFEVPNNYLGMIHAYWKTNVVEGWNEKNPTDSYNMKANSSCVIWRPCDLLAKIPKFFVDSDSEFMQLKYKGFDRFLYDNCRYAIKWLPEDWFYSLRYGGDRSEALIEMWNGMDFE